MTGVVVAAAWRALPVAPSLLGESPFWHPDEGALYWCDIPGKRLNRWVPDGDAFDSIHTNIHTGIHTGIHTAWPLESEPGSCAPLPGGDLMLACRDGLWRFSPASGQRQQLAAPPYDTATERFNDGKADPQGRFWVGTIYEPRKPANAVLYRWAGAQLQAMARDITVSNGLAFSPDGRTLYRSDTASHRIFACDFDGTDGSLSHERVFGEFPLRQAGQDLSSYGGRPDGAAVDAEGAYWCAMFEGQRLLRFSPAGAVLAELPLPVRCPTMPCFGGPDLRTLYVTTACLNRPADELAAQPLAGCVLSLRVDVPGLPVNFARI